MSLDPIAVVITFIDQRLVSLLKLPDAWGSPESVEQQVLLLLEIRMKARSVGDEGLRERYQRFLASRLGHSPCTLADRLSLEFSTNEQFIRLLKGFAQEEYLLGFSRPAFGMPKRDLSTQIHYELEA